MDNEISRESAFLTAEEKRIPFHKIFFQEKENTPPVGELVSRVSEVKFCRAAQNTSLTPIRFKGQGIGDSIER